MAHRGCRGGAQAEGRRRGHRRQDQHLRIGPMAIHQRPGVRAHPQPVVKRTHAGRLLGRQRCCRGGRIGGGGHRLRWRGQCAHSRRVDAPRRHQTAAGADLHLAVARGVQRHHCQRGVGTHGHRCGPRAGRSVGQRARRPASAATGAGVRLRRAGARPAEDRDVDEVPLHRLPRQAAPRDPGGHGDRRGPTRATRAHHGEGRPGLQHWDVVELPVPVDVGAARLGRSPRPERNAGQADAGQYADRLAAFAEHAAQGAGPRSQIAAQARLDLQSRRRRAGPDHTRSPRQG